MARSKLLQKRTRPRNGDDSILPLINVVFLLLIFFMIAGKLSASDLFPIAPPASVSEAHASAQEMEILIAADGRLALDDVLVDPDSLRNGVEQRLAGAADVSIHLKADGDTEAVRVVEVLELLREAGVEKLHLLTVQESH